MMPLTSSLARLATSAVSRRIAASACLGLGASHRVATPATIYQPGSRDGHTLLHLSEDASVEGRLHDTPVEALLRRHLDAIFTEPQDDGASHSGASRLGQQASGRSSMRTSTAAVAARIARHHPQPAAPATVEAALQPSTQSRLVIEARPPLGVVHATHAWERATGIGSAGADNHPASSILQGSAANAEGMQDMSHGMSRRQNINATLVGHSGWAPNATRMPAAPVADRASDRSEHCVLIVSGL